MKKIDPSRPVRTVKTHKPVEIISTKGRYEPLLGYVDKDLSISGWSLEGVAHYQEDENIENVPEKKVMYANIYPDTNDLLYVGSLYPSKERADAHSTGDRIARIRFEYEEGQFDE